MKNNKFIYMLSSLLLTSCHVNKSNDSFKVRLNNYYQSGFRFYETINLFYLQGDNSVDINAQEIAFPFYGLLKKDGKVSVLEIMSKSQIENREYRYTDKFLISTEITKDDELQSSYFRSVKIIDSIHMATFGYVIQDNYEYLHGIEIEYSNGVKRTYQNTTNVFYHYSFPLIDSNVISQFPTLDLIKTFPPAESHKARL